MDIDYQEYRRTHLANMALAASVAEHPDLPCVSEDCVASGRGTFVGETAEGVIMCHFCETPVVAIEEGARLAA